jgi:hypothetical protein
LQNFEKEMFRAVVKIPAVPIELDCMFSISATLFENMQQLESLLPDEIRAFFVLHEGNLFVEESSGRILNPFISCRRFSFWEGVTFLIC